jgi:NADH-quinone oxidoreductase subunit J
VFATANSVATPALLPDGSIAPEPLSALIESAPADEPELPSVDAHALTGAPAAPDSDHLTGETHR